jgi:uncharacterized membrane protein
MTSDGDVRDPARPRAEINDTLSGFSPRRQEFSRAVTTFVEPALAFFYRHWLAILNSALVIFIGIAFLAPIGYALGYTGPSSVIFDVYRYFCGQTPSHSFYVAGYQMCLCSRCLAIYTSLLTGGLILAMFRHRRSIQPISWRLWALGMLPMALDGGTQLIGWHESNVYLRLLTGAIFGLMTAWFILPQIEESSEVEPAVEVVSA